MPPARPLDLAPGAGPRLPPCFSRRANSPTAARLTPKALRLHAEQGLLPPAEVDPATGYRYYDPGQLPRARLIGRLRALGLPLARIASMVELSPATGALELRWPFVRSMSASQRRLRAERDRLDERAAVIEALQEGPSPSLVSPSGSGTRRLARSSAGPPDRHDPAAAAHRQLRARHPGPPRPVRRAAAPVLRRPGHARPRRRRRGGGAVLGPGRTDRRPARPPGAGAHGGVARGPARPRRPAP
ncbi:MerR family transcriptional regulator [Actinoplanes sp. NPDC051343]|uniref:MerR family transcriptional regulator n=1 Tax=Actinoplanes sp. NPDC051343 TaxID=3363906 RepID=UPI003792F4E8